jgi:DNA invertase Pin-like site-specific DNA recombinase
MDCKGDSMSKPKQEVIFAVLARVSTRSQEDGQSLPMQVDACRAYALRAGATKVLVYEGVESGTGADRDILDRLQADIGRLKIQGVVIQDLSRLARHPGVMFAAAERFRLAGVALHDLNGPIPFESPEGEFRVMIESVVGRFTARQGVQKSISARARILASGRPAAGRPPWGRLWDQATGRYEVIPDMRAQLESAYDLIVNQGISLNKTAAKLHMQASSLRKAIRQSSKTEVTQRLGGKEYKFKCAPVLTKKQHDELDVAIAGNAIMRPRTKGQYLLQGLVHCDACMAFMTGQTSTKDGKSYAIYRHPSATYKKGVCVWQVSVPLLDHNVLGDCASVVSDKAVLIAAIEQAQTDSGSHDVKRRLEFNELEIKRVDTRLGRTLQTLIVFDQGSESRKRLEASAKTDETALADLRRERDELLQQYTSLNLSREAVDMAAIKARSLYWGHGAGTKVLTFEQKREFVRTIVGQPLDRAGALGVYVTMIRPPKASKKNVSWKYRVQGVLMVSNSDLSPCDEDAPPRFIGQASPEQVKRLAQIAAASPGITFPRRRIYPVQMRTKYSSGASRRCG